MKFKILFLVVLSVSLGMAQQAPDAALFGGAAPIIAPQSPEAATIARYGSIPLNSATGQMSYSIPFYDISVDGNSWPISLNYNYGGLILEGKPSMMGLGWHLSGGGAVTREIRGLPDEHKYGYFSQIGTIPVKDIVYDYINGGIDDVSLTNIRRFIGGFQDYEPLDGEVDKYTVSVGGLHFSFKLGLDTQPGVNNNLEPVYLSQHGHKVRIIWSDNPNGSNDSGNYEIDAIEVTDTNGTRYYFDQYEWTVPKGDEEFSLHSRTAWNLTFIEYINGQKIEFIYDDHTYNDYNFTAAGSALFVDIDQDNANQQIYVSPSYNEATFESEIARKVLKRIDFPKGQIVLTYEDKNQIIGDPSRIVYTDAVLSSNMPGANTIEHFEFTHTGSRDLLTQINRNGEHHYGFEYYEDSTIPEFIKNVSDRAYDQDTWKFYNGAGNSAALNIPNSPNTANKTSNFFKTRLGALKTIIYPTRGSTTVKYQQNQIKTDVVLDSDYYNSLPAGKSLVVNYDGQNYQLDQYGNRVVSQTLTFDYPTLVSISHSLQGERSDNNLFFKIYRTDGSISNGYVEISTPLYLSNYYDEAPYLREQIQIRNLPYNFEFPIMSPQLSYEFGPDDGAPGFVSETFDGGGRFVVMPGEYTFEITSHAAVPTLSATGLINVQIFGQFNQPPPDFANKNIGGIRVSEIVDCPDNASSNCVTRQFNYNDADGFSTGSLYAIPLDKVVHSWWQTLLDGNVYYKEAHAFLSQPFTVSNAGYGTPVFYNYIEEKRIKNGVGTIGFERRKYSFPKENQNFNYTKRPTGLDLDKSFPTEVEIYEEGNPDPVQVSKTNYQQVRHTLHPFNLQDENPNHPWSIKVAKKQDLVINFLQHEYNLLPIPGSADEAAVKDLYGFYPYREVDNWDKVVQTTVISDGMTTVTDLSYNENQIVNEQTTTDSRGNEVKKELFFANDFQSDPIYGGMFNNNQLAQPVLEKSYYNNVLQGQSKTDFVWVNQGYRPYKTFAAKADNDFEAKLKFDYNTNGTIKQVDYLLDSPNRNNDGVEKVLKSTSYIWGYSNEFPVVKVENATFNEVEATGVSLTDLKSFNATFSEKQFAIGELQNALDGAFVTGYAYNPLIGVSDMIDPRGYATHYTYDNLNRLLNVKDADENLLEEYEYKYRAANYVNPENPNAYPTLVGSISGPDTVDYGSTHGYSVTPTGGSQNYNLTWYQDGVQLGTGTSANATFNSSASTYVRVDILDVITGHGITVKKLISVDAQLAISPITPNTEHILVNDALTFNAPAVSGGSEDYTYRWLVDNTQVFAGTTPQNLTYNQFDTAKPFVITYEVTDNSLNVSSTVTKTVNVYNPLASFSLNGDIYMESGKTKSYSASGVTGGSGSYNYAWEIVNGATLGTAATASFTPATDGSYTIRLTVSDANIANHQQQADLQLTVYEALTIPTVAASKTNVLVGKTVDFTTANIGGGSPFKTYKWYNSGNEISNETGTTYSDSFTFGPQNIVFEVYDTRLNTAVQSDPVSVQVYNNLTLGTVSADINPVLVGNSVRFIATGISGGSSDYSRQWYIDGAPVSGETGWIMDKSFATAGSFDVSLVVTDNLLLNALGNPLSVEPEVTLTVNPNLIVSNLIAPSTVTVNGTANFDVNITSGSGNYSYAWKVQKGSTIYNATTKSFSKQLGYAYYGSVYVECKVTDNVTGQEQTVTTNLTVNGAPTLTGKQNVSQVYNDNNIEYNVRINVINLNGSGDYSYAWTNDNQNAGTAATSTVYLDCNDQSDRLICVITDNITGQTKTTDKTYTFSGSCSGGGNQ